MKVLLTAANGFIGQALGQFLFEKGFEVCGTVRKDRLASFRPPWLKELFALDLRQTDRKSCGVAFRGVDIVIHLAHDFAPEMAESNVRSTKFLAQAASDSGAGLQIFFSSYSARADALSEYGTVKYRLEQFFLEAGHTVVRPGLVIGRGGLFLKFYNAVRRYPVIPLPDGGRGEVPLISIRQLCEAIYMIIVSTSPQQKEYNLFYPDMATMKELVDALKTASGSKALVLPLPVKFLAAAVKAVSLTGIRLPFDPESFRAFQKNQERVHQSNLDLLFKDFDSVTDAINAAFAAA